MFDAKHLLVIIACLKNKVKIKNHLILDDFPKYNLDWCRWWDSNPHGFPLDFESSASTNSATAAFAIFAVCLLS